MFNKQWFKATAIRVIRTMAQTAVALIGTSVIVQEVDWFFVLSGTILSGIICALMCIGSLPEVENG